MMKVGIDRSKFILRCFHSFFTRFAFERGTVKRRHKTGLKMFMKRRHHKPRGEPVGADGEKKRAGSIETFLRLFLYPRFTAGTKTIGQFYENGRESGCWLPPFSESFSAFYIHGICFRLRWAKLSPTLFGCPEISLTLAVSFKAFGTEETELGGFSDLIIDLWREEQLKDGSHWRLARRAGIISRMANLLSGFAEV